MQFDYEYLCRGLGSLTGLEVRVYRDGEMVFHAAPFDFTPDIAGLVLSRAGENADNVYHIETDELLVFGVIRTPRDDVAIIIGPTSHIVPGENEAIAILYQLNASYDKLPQLRAYLDNMIPYPLENFLSILCFINYALNDEKLSAADIIGKGGVAVAPVQDEMPAGGPNDDATQEHNDIHNTLHMEKQLLSLITTGNVQALAAFFDKPAEGRIGQLAHNELRQRKNSFIVTATLVSRAAITGGLSPQVAFALSDRYIQKAELLNTGSQLTALSMELLLDYTRRVAALKLGAEDSPLAREVMQYVLKHISHKISTADVAMALELNRTYLCERFKQDTGVTITDFITEMKMDEAKRMLEVSNLTIAEISEYLAFSTQSYFQTVFKKTQCCTPKQYRDSAGK